MITILTSLNLSQKIANTPLTYNGSFLYTKCASVVCLSRKFHQVVYQTSSFTPFVTFTYHWNKFCTHLTLVEGSQRSIVECSKVPPEKGSCMKKGLSKCKRVCRNVKGYFGFPEKGSWKRGWLPQNSISCKNFPKVFTYSRLRNIFERKCRLKMRVHKKELFEGTE